MTQQELIPSKYIERSSGVVGKHEFSMVESPVSKEQIIRILQRTPKDHIYTRPAKGGGQWEFVTGVYVKKVLNYIFGFLWSFEVKEHTKEGNQVQVLGRLTIKNQVGNDIIIKEQWGRADIKMKKGTNQALDYGNDLKAATTDALKKCASELGIASDIYGKNEFKDIKIPEPTQKEEATNNALDKLNQKIKEKKDGNNH